jgi:hypothetical protein
MSEISSNNAQGNLDGYDCKGVGKKGWSWRKRGGRLIAGTVFGAVGIRPTLAQSESNNSNAPTTKRYLPEYTASGDLILPKKFDEWVSVG